MGLTKKKIDAARYKGDGKSWDIRYDGALPGFGVRVFPSEVKSYVLRYRTRTGRTRLLTLGRHGVLTLDQAREKARKELVKVTDGADPVADRKAESKTLTVKEFAEIWLDRHAKPHRAGSWKEDKRRLEKRIIPAIGGLALRDVKRSDLAALHGKIGATTPIEANRVIQLARTVLSTALAWGHLPEGSKNPAEMDRTGKHGIKPFKERSRERYVLPHEMPKLIEAIDAEPNIYIRASFWLYLLTGLRRNELLRSRWDDVDLDSRAWRVRRKGGEIDTVPLSVPAAAILEALPRYKNNPHVFPGHKRGSHLVNIDKNWRGIRESAGCADVTVHDLRRSVGSWMATAGVSLQIIGQVLGHAPGDVQATAIYARLERDASRQALEDHAERVMAMVNGKKDPAAARAARIVELEAELARLRSETGGA